MAFNIGFYAYAILGHTRADQLLPQLLMEQFDTFLYNVDTFHIIRFFFQVEFLCSVTLNLIFTFKYVYPFKFGFFMMC